MKEFFHFRFRNYNLFPKDNVAHRAFFAKRNISTQDINSHIRNFELDLLSGSCPKRIYWGNPGVGKSHTMLHIVSFLEQKNFKFVYVECPPVMKTAGFITLFKIFLDNYGKKEILELIENTSNKCRMLAQNNNPEFYKRPDEFAYPHLKSYFIDDDFIEISKFINDSQRHNFIWNWLHGEPFRDGPSRDTLEDNISKLKDVFLAILKMSDKIDGKKLILVFDELDKTVDLNQSSASQWAYMFTQLTDDSQLSAVVILGFTAAAIEEVNVVDASVLRRVGNFNSLNISEIRNNEFMDFVKDLIQYNRNPDYDFTQDIKQFQNEAGGEKLELEYLPFTIEAIEKLKTRLARPNPSTLMNYMNRACAECQSNNEHIITSKVMERVIPSTNVTSR